MTALGGIFAACIAFLGWGFGDFTIQRSVRRVGTVTSLLAITGLGAIVLLPFAWKDIPTLMGSLVVNALLIFTALLTTVTAIFEFASFREGKIAVTEPILSLELVLTVAIGIGFLGERLTGAQILLALGVFSGILLTAWRRDHRHWWQRWQRFRWLEHGVLLALTGMLFMAFVNVFTGLASRATNPVTAIWYIHAVMSICLLAWISAHGRTKNVVHDVRTHWRLLMLEGALDNAAWIGFAFAVLVLPISLAIAMTESYIALAALLGILWNKEKLQEHQLYGMSLTLTAAVLLALSST